MATSVAHPEAELKRLGFLVGVAEASYSYLSTKTQPYATRAINLYSTCKESSSTLKPRIVSIESAIQHFGAVVLEKSKAAAPKLLQDVDTRVDATLTAASAALERSLSTVGVSSLVNAVQTQLPKDLATFHEVRDQYFSQLEAAIATVQARAPLLPAEAYLALGGAIAAARTAGSEGYARTLTAVVAAWEAFVANPTVKELLSKSQLALLLLKKKAIVAARAIHASPTFVACEAKARSTIAAVQHHQRFLEAKAYVDPFLDPALQRITSSSYYGRVAESIKPLIAELQAELQVDTTPDSTSSDPEE